MSMIMEVRKRGSNKVRERKKLLQDHEHLNTGLEFN